MPAVVGSSSTRSVDHGTDPCVNQLDHFIASESSTSLDHFPRGPNSLSEREVLKVLATRDPVDAGLLSLPPLGDTYLPRSPRGSNLSSLDELFRILHQPLIAQRNVALASSPSSGWTTSQTELEIYREIAP